MPATHHVPSPPNIPKGTPNPAMPQLKGEHHRAAKLTAADVLAIREAYRPGRVTMQELADAYGVSPQQIGYIVRGQRWKHLLTPPSAGAPGEKGRTA